MSSEKPPTLTRNLPELLAPAGNWACVRSAVNNGADAVYFALDKFNARIRAENFSLEDLPRLIEYLHLHGVRAYACINTLIFENELEEVETYVRRLVEAGVDGILVQDVGVATLIRQISPDIPMHASTQMTVTSSAGVEFAHQLGCSVVVLARECTLQTIKNIKNRITSLVPPVSLEVFVHGALCISYSGQCFASRALGNRSANRGDCAQVCRLPYELVSDKKKTDLAERRYLLSAQDLAAIDLLPQLVSAGIGSLKIEGRLKSPEYVAAITRIYREALDSLASSTTCSESSSPPQPATTANTWFEMEMAFSRGLCPGWLPGINHRSVVHARFAKNRGSFVGTVLHVRNTRVIINATREIKPGDGLLFCTPDQDNELAAGKVYSVRPVGESALTTTPGEITRSHARKPTTLRLLELGFGRSSPNITSVVRPDAEVWKTSDAELERKWTRLAKCDNCAIKRPVWFHVQGALGQPLRVTAHDNLGHTATAVSTVPLHLATNVPLTQNTLREQFGRLGGTQFKLAGITSDLPSGLILPLSELNRIRRALVNELEQLRAQPARWRLATGTPHPRPLCPRSTVQPNNVKPHLTVLVRTFNQFEAVFRAGVQTIYCDFGNLSQYHRAMTFRDRFSDKVANAPAPDIFVAGPRICMDGEEPVLHALGALGAAGYLVRNYDQLKFFRGNRCVGDFSLNIANSLSAHYFMTNFGLERLTPSYDMDVNHLETMLASAPAAWFEVPVYQHVPMFHMAHCIFCAFLSHGKDRSDCGAPCRLHTVQLRDRHGMHHPVKADMCCRNTVFEARPKTLNAHVSKLLKLGIRHFRIEFVDEDPVQVTQVLRKYISMLNNEGNHQTPS